MLFFSFSFIKKIAVDSFPRKTLICRKLVYEMSSSRAKIVARPEKCIKRIHRSNSAHLIGTRLPFSPGPEAVYK